MKKVFIFLAFILISGQLIAQHASSAFASIGASIVSPVRLGSESNIIEGRLIKTFARSSLANNKVLLLDEISPVFYIGAETCAYDISIMYEPHASKNKVYGLRVASLAVISENKNEEVKSYRVKPVIVADSHLIPGNYTDPGICRVTVHFN